MKWTTEKRYKRYEDWSEAERDQLKSTMENPLGERNTM